MKLEPHFASIVHSVFFLLHIHDVCFAIHHQFYSFIKDDSGDSNDAHFDVLTWHIQLPIIEGNLF